MQNEIDKIYNGFIEIEESIQALAITTEILKGHFDRDTDREVHHIMLTIHENIEQIGSKMQKVLSEFDEYLVKK